jgi:prepilin-type N-terminal cleavage/methylation domain-containing protein
MLSNKKGFTLIELLIVVVIIGILAAIAIPKFANTKEKAYIATMKADLRNLVTAQEAYFSEKTAYTDVAACAATGLGYSCSSGVQVEAEANLGKGWQATATHTGTDQTCIIKTGSYVGSTEADGEPVCA